MRAWHFLALGAVSMLAGCSEYGYRYQPHPQVLYSPIFADYRESGSKIDILVDTDGLRLQQVAIVKADGTTVQPTAVDYPQFKAELMRGTTSEIYGPPLAAGPTVAHFDKDAIGPGPWNIKVQIQDVPPETIHVGSAMAGE